MWIIDVVLLVVFVAIGGPFGLLAFLILEAVCIIVNTMNRNAAAIAQAQQRVVHIHHYEEDDEDC
jgi:hypothetical protein